MENTLEFVAGFFNGFGTSTLVPRWDFLTVPDGISSVTFRKFTLHAQFSSRGCKRFPTEYTLLIKVNFIKIAR